MMPTAAETAKGRIRVVGVMMSGTPPLALVFASLVHVAFPRQDNGGTSRVWVAFTSTRGVKTCLLPIRAPGMALRFGPRK
jgi:hypothetical protein